MVIGKTNQSGNGTMSDAPVFDPLIRPGEWKLVKELQEAAQKLDQEKPRMELLDPYFLDQVARVLTFGANKYAAHNWRKGLAISRTLGATYRHLNAFNAGEDIDAETGLSHLAHAGCEVMFTLWAHKYLPDLDDRFKYAERIS